MLHWKSKFWLETGTKNVAGLNQLMGYQPFPLDNWIYKLAIQIKNKESKTFTDLLPLKKTTNYHKNSNTMAGSMNAPR